MSAASPRNGVLLLAGYGIQVKVERGHLAVEEGVGANRRHARFHRADREIKRLAVLGHAGTITFDALRWLSDVGAGFMQIDSDGKVIAAAGPIGLQDARLRRAQALAAENGCGLAIARELAREKLEGQASVLDRLPDSEEAKGIVQSGISRIGSASTVEQLRAIEAEGALAYWGVWSPIEIRFARRDWDRIPEHWPPFGRRASLVTGSSRKATNPCNAILNYLYAIAEAEARIAALAVGCDPGLGVMHADQKSRDSLACDLMEPVRPRVDRWVLRLLAERTFRKSDFFETREGVCRIMPPLTQLLAETAPRWRAAVAVVRENSVQPEIVRLFRAR
jgi:CRISPR-associated endonuclease Cas1